MDYKKQQKDLSFGFKSEDDIHEILEGYFGKLLKSKFNPEMGKYYEFDKYNEEYFIEIKSRRIRHNQYESLFKNVKKHHKIIAEGTTQYFYSEVAINKILKYKPNAKFILCLRNPVDMAISKHSERVYQGEENLKSFESAWKYESKRINGVGIPKAMIKNPLFVQYGKVCSHGFWLSKLLKQIDFKNLHIVFLDDIIDNPEKSFNNILTFLNLKKDKKIILSHENKAKQVNFFFMSYLVGLGVYLKKKLIGNRKTNIAAKIRKLNTYNKKNKEISDDLRNEMKKYFYNDICLLEKLTNRNLSSWK